MQNSTVMREKLIPWPELCGIAVLFVVGFVILKPSSDTFDLSLGAAVGAEESALDELDIAYFRAQQASLKQTDQQDTGNLEQVLARFIREEQFFEAESLLERYPAIEVSDTDQFRLNLERVAQQVEATTEPPSGTLAAALRAQLFTVTNDPTLHQAPLLARSASLSYRLDDQSLTGELYHLLAINDESEAARWYLVCGRLFMADQQLAPAETCFTQASLRADDTGSKLDSQLALLRIFHLTEQRAAEQALIDQLLLSDHYSETENEAIASALLETGKPQFAYPRYRALADTDTARRQHWLTVAARWAEASNRPDLAAAYLAETLDDVPEQEQATLRTKIQSLQLASGDNEKAWETLVASLSETPDNIDLLQQGVSLARTREDYDQALAWHAHLATLAPEDESLIETSIDLAMATRDLETGMQWAQRGVTRYPDSRPLRLRLAQLSEWTGDPVGAQTQWQWLVEQQPDIRALNELARLSELNRYPSVTARSLGQLAQIQRPDNNLLRRLISAYEHNGEPKVAADVINGLLARYGETRSWLVLLADHYKRHVLYDEALATWNRLANRHGEQGRVVLERMELNWRVDQPDEAAVIAQQLESGEHLKTITPMQFRIALKIAERYERPRLLAAIQPALPIIDSEAERQKVADLLLSALEASGDKRAAVAHAESLWQGTGEPRYLLSAMRLNTDSNTHYDAELDEHTAALDASPEYWMLRAENYQREGDSLLAESAYQQTLSLDPDNTQALEGLLWLYISDNRDESLTHYLNEAVAIAENRPGLWAPVAVGLYQTGDVERSLGWFEKLIDTMDSDYGMLLTYADALDVVGRAEQAYLVRHYALTRLRPVLVNGTRDDQDALLAQYARLITKFGTAEENERVVRWMLASQPGDLTAKSVGQQEVIMSWLMATQRMDHARLYLARLHQARIKTPAWQQVSLALNDNNLQEIESLLGAGAMTSASQIVALRSLGRVSEAYALSSDTLDSYLQPSERHATDLQYRTLRDARPDYYGGRFIQRSADALSVTSTGINLRHSFAFNNDPGGVKRTLQGLGVTGFSIDYTQHEYRTETLFLSDLAGDLASRADLELSSWFANRRHAGSLSAGFSSTDTHDLFYGLGNYNWRDRSGRRLFSADFRFNAPYTDNSTLGLAAIRNALSTRLELPLGSRDFIALGLGADEIMGRVEQAVFARRMESRAEVGRRSTFAGHAWSLSLAATHQTNERDDTLPAELRFSNGLNLEDVLNTDNSQLAIIAGINRGNVYGNYPQSGSPRYFANVTLGHNWPREDLSFSVDTGAGIRVLGGDELSVIFSHNQDQDELGSFGTTGSMVGLNYRNHF